MTPSRLILAALACARAAGVLWSTLGVVDDGRSDNTAALNALPVGTLVEGDCPHGGVIFAQSVWLLRSHLFVRVQAGCEILSNSTGINSYAISQLDRTTPLLNVTLLGLTVAKTTRVAGDRVLLAYINGFQLLNWTFYHHGGAMFLRGSCQEIAGGRSFDDAGLVGSPGVRHVGNLPKAGCARPQPADVWVHDNNIISGDGAYQACQPLDTALWVNVSSDDMRWEANTGSSIHSAFILVGESAVQPQHSGFSCTNVTFWNMQGAGLRLIYVQAAAPPNVVEGIVLWVGAFTNARMEKIAHQEITGPPFPLSPSTHAPQNRRDLVLSSTDVGPHWPAAIEISAQHGGVVRSVLMDGIRALGIPKRSLNETGLLDSVVFTNGYLSTPTVGGLSSVNIDGGASAELSNTFIGGFNGNNVNIGATTLTQGTRVLNCTVAGVNSNSVGIALGSANGSVALGSYFSIQHGATNTTGIATDANVYAATTHAAIHDNDVRAVSTGIICGHGDGNSISNNPGAKDCTPMFLLRHAAAPTTKQRYVN